MTRLRTTKGESTEQGPTRQSRASVRGSKRIRYPRSPRCKPCLLRVGDVFHRNVISCPSPSTRNPSVWVQGGVRLQDRNLKELTEWHHKAWSVRLNLTQHGKRYLDSTWQGYDRLKYSRDNSASGAWPFLVGEVICLVDSDNERGLHLPVGNALAHSRASWSPGSRELRRVGAIRWRPGPRVAVLLLSGLRHFVSTKCLQPEANSRSVMPLDAQGCTRTTMTL